jgi:hypothetical protein
MCGGGGDDYDNNGMTTVNSSYHGCCVIHSYNCLEASKLGAALDICCECL